MPVACLAPRSLATVFVFMAAGMKVNLSALATGILFGMGLMLSGMSNPR
ncbi:hypothetical protein [Propionivibrio sp.]